MQQREDDNALDEAVWRNWVARGRARELAWWKKFRLAVAYSIAGLIIVGVVVWIGR